MKSFKQLMNVLLTFALLASVFLYPVLPGFAQTDQDWSHPVNLSLSGAATGPVTVVDSRGFLHAIWVDEVDGYKYAESRDRITWSDAQTVKFPFGPGDPPPTLVPGVGGTVHVFWLSSDQRLLYGQATPGDLPYPQNWIFITRLANSVVSYDVIMDSKGIPHVAFIQSKLAEGNPAGVYYTQSPSAGGYWTQSRLLYQSEYFRSAAQSDLYVRISTSDTVFDQRVYISWDNRAQKRVYMAVSDDSGSSWNEPQQIKGPEDTGGFDTPFNLTVSAFGREVLLIWQVGEPGSSKCTVYSQWSQDGGENWGDAVAVLGGRSECPLGTKIIDRNEEYMSVIFVGEVSPFVVAWNGSQWSDVQAQTQLPSLINPLTFDAILLGCRFDLFYENRLYVTGCDEGRGGDVWFLSRTLSPVGDWFSPSVVWDEPDVLSIRTENPERISNFYSAHDDFGNIHAVWAQSRLTDGEGTNASITYARWNGDQWTAPESILSSTGGLPTYLTVTADSLQRLLLSWIDSSYGDLVFSWANIELANLASEWTEVTGIPTPSRLVESADVLADGSGRIVNAYVVPINEDRGVYIVQSEDAGRNWSDPVLVFDAVSAGWERIEQPRLTLDSLGVLHVIFIRDTMREGQPVGLYYTRSSDGGMSWSEVQNLSEGQIYWADIASYDEQTVHVVWQEYDGLVFANISQFSQDGGVNWGRQNDVTGVNEAPTSVSLVSDGQGFLHFIQLIDRSEVDSLNQKDLVLQDWKWNGADWNPEVTKEILLKGEGIRYSISADVASNGYLSVFMPVEYVNPDGNFVSEILTFSRYLEEAVIEQSALVAVLPVSEDAPDVAETPIVLPTSTPDFSILYDDNVSTSPLQQNLAGFLLVGVGVVATVFLLLWRRPLKREK